MTPYIVAETGDTPRIEMNAEKGIFLLKGKSLPENTHLFYDPVVKWMSMYRAQANQQTNLVCKLEYFNTASSKKILEVIEELKAITGKISVEWHYLVDDDDMLEIGKEYSELTKLPFTYIMDHNF
jgi:hypothetical protein